METIIARLTVMFDDPFWIGIYERESGGCYEACKITFGAEPKDSEVYAFMLENWSRLRFGVSSETKRCEEKRINPKRMQREISRYVESASIGTKAQRALKLQQELGKAERKSCSKKQSEEEKARRFEMHRERQKEKHRGH